MRKLVLVLLLFFPTISLAANNVMVSNGTTSIDWSNVTGWAAEGAGSSIALETTILPPYGGNALRVTNSNAGGTGQTSNYTLPNQPVLGESTIIEVPVYLPTDHIGGTVTVSIGSGGGVVNAYSKSISSPKTLKGWNVYRFTLAEMTKSGTPVLTTLNTIRLRFLAPAGVTTYAIFGPITIGRTYRPWVMITFDDGLKTVITAAKPLLDARGLRATVFVPYFNLFGPTTFTQAQLLEMYTAKWTIASHTFDHTTMETGSPTDIVKYTTLKRGQSSLTEFGPGYNFLAWPGGEYDDTAVTYADGLGILLSRSTQNEVMPLGGDGFYQKNRLPGWSFDSGSRTSAQVITEINNAINKQQSTIWYGHNIVTPVVLTTDISIAELTIILDEIVRLRDSNVISVGTVQDFYEATLGYRRRR